jgi:putative ABC transport system substrate-binding protein
MRRREFITLVGVAAVKGPSAARAQQAAKLPTIGFSGPALWASAFEQRLRELGWVAARTVAIEYRSAEGHNERYSEIATEFVRLKVNVIVTVGGSPTLDPVGSGLVASLARPDSNATGIMGHPIGLAGKRLDLLREVLPSFRRLSVISGQRAARSVAYRQGPRCILAWSAEVHARRGYLQRSYDRH